MASLAPRRSSAGIAMLSQTADATPLQIIRDFSVAITRLPFAHWNKGRNGEDRIAKLHSPFWKGVASRRAGGQPLRRKAKLPGVALASRAPTSHSWRPLPKVSRKASWLYEMAVRVVSMCLCALCYILGIFSHNITCERPRVPVLPASRTISFFPSRLLFLMGTWSRIQHLPAARTCVFMICVWLMAS